MPLPERKPGESHDEFIERCMGDAVMVEEFPDAAQRRAVCQRQGRVRTEVHLNLVCDPGSITIEAASADASADAGAKPKLPRFSMVAYTGGPMRIAGWRYPVIVDLAGLAIPSQSRPIRFGHDMQSGVGHTDAIRIEDGRLVATGVVSRDTQAAREIVVSARNGFPWQASIAAAVEEFEFVKEGQQVLVNGRQFAGPVNVVRKASLGEISFVDLGADGATSASLAAARREDTTEMASVFDTHKPAWESTMQPDKMSTDDGTVHAAASAAPAPPSEPPTSEAPAVEAAQVLAIRLICGGKHPEIEAQAIQEHWDVNRTALAVLRAERPAAPAIHMVHSGCDLQALEAGIRLGAHQCIEHDYPAQVLERAVQYRAWGLHDVARAVCALEGVTLPTNVSQREWVAAAFSTRSLATLLSNVANKTLLAGYQAVDRASLRVSKILTAQDFKSHNAVRLSGAYVLEKVAPDGELKHATLTDQGYPFRVETFGKLIGLTRQDIVNDDLGAFTELPYQIGRGAALALESAFWAMVEAANGTFFSSDNKNVISGAGSAFGIEGLNAAIAKLRKQTDEYSQPIKARPRYVAVPPDLEADATQIYTSNVLLLTGTTDNVIGANNPHANKYEPVVSEYLTGSGAASAWYLVADPADVPAFGVAFLRGQDVPVIEEAEPDPKYLGTLWRGYLDFGVCLLDPRGAVRANGS